MSAIHEAARTPVPAPQRLAWALAGLAVLALVSLAAGHASSADATDAHGAWRIERDPATGSARAALPSHETLSLAGEPVQPELVIGCRDGATGIWLDFGRPVHPALAPMRVSLRLDQGRPTQATWNTDTDQRRAQMVETRFDSALRRARPGSDDFSSRTATDLARELVGHERLAIRTATAYAGHLALGFELAGIQGALDRIADACGWSASLRASLH